MLFTDYELDEAELQSELSKKVVLIKRHISEADNVVTADESLGLASNRYVEAYGPFDYGIYVQATEPYRPPHIAEKVLQEFLLTDADTACAASTTYKNYWIKGNGVEMGQAVPHLRK